MAGRAARRRELAGELAGELGSAPAIPRREASALAWVGGSNLRLGDVSSAWYHAGVTPRNLFDHPAIETSHELFCLRGLGYDFLRELGVQFVTSAQRVRVDLVYQQDFDHRRFWRLMTVRLDDQPVMVLQNAGREGSDFSRRLIVDHEAFTLLLAHLNSRGVALTVAVAAAEDAREEVVPLDDELPALTNFAGFSWENGALREVEDA